MLYWEFRNAEFQITEFTPELIISISGRIIQCIRVAYDYTSDLLCDSASLFSPMLRLINGFKFRLISQKVLRFFLKIPGVLRCKISVELAGRG